MPTAGQINGALAMLGWSNEVTSDKSGVGISTIRRARSGKKIVYANMVLLVQTIENAGVYIDENDGVRRIK